MQTILKQGKGKREQGTAGDAKVRGLPLIHDKTVDEWGTTYFNSS
jgi:hypothetical protein